MVIVGVPYSESHLAHMGDVTGGTPHWRDDTGRTGWLTATQ